MKCKHNEGFTLVEISIVLVIVGLIIGGILVGQDMIRAATIRSAVSQINTFNSAVNTFRDKYRYIPGDMAAGTAAQYGFPTRTGATGHGDGSGLIEGGAAGATLVSGEPTMFWVDLNQASMMAGSFTTGTDGTAVTAANGDAVKAYLPESKLSNGNMITIYSTGNYNWYEIHGITSIAAGTPTLYAAISPSTASTMDTKMDDGMPLTGTFIALNGTGTFNSVATPAAAASGVCVDSTGNVYNTTVNTTTSPWATVPSCGVRVRAQ